MWRGILMGLAFNSCVFATAMALTADELVGIWEGVDAKAGWKDRLILTRIDDVHGWWQAHMERFTADGEQINTIDGIWRLGIDKRRPSGCRLVLYFGGDITTGAPLGHIVRLQMSITMPSKDRMRLICPTIASIWGPDLYVRVRDPSAK